jgi:hypothetical protein
LRRRSTTPTTCCKRLARDSRWMLNIETGRSESGRPASSQAGVESSCLLFVRSERPPNGTSTVCLGDNRWPAQLSWQDDQFGGRSNTNTEFGVQNRHLRQKFSGRPGGRRRSCREGHPRPRPTAANPARPIRAFHCSLP